MDGKGRYQDNILAGRLWRTVKYEEVHLKAYANGAIARSELSAYFRFYNNQRPHQDLGYRTPAKLFHRDQTPPVKGSKERRCSIRSTKSALTRYFSLSLWPQGPQVRSG